MVTKQWFDSVSYLRASSMTRPVRVHSRWLDTTSRAARLDCTFTAQSRTKLAIWQQPNEIAMYCIMAVLRNVEHETCRQLTTSISAFPGPVHDHRLTWPRPTHETTVTLLKGWQRITQCWQPLLLHTLSNYHAIHSLRNDHLRWGDLIFT